MPILRPGDGWHRAVAAWFETGDSAHLRALQTVLCDDLGARPNQDSHWRQQVHNLDRGRHRWTVQVLSRMLEALADSVPLAAPSAAADGRPLLVGQANTVCAVNLLWAAVELDLERVTQLTGRVLLRSVSEPWLMRSARVRGACANVLAEIGSRQAVDLLARASQLAQTKTLREQMLLGLERTASRNQEPPSRLAELHVPHHGLDERGRLELTVHRHRFELRLYPDGQVGATQRDGEPTPDEAASRVTAAESRGIRAAYLKEVARIEALLATDRRWDPEDWERIYLDNPITRAVAGRLIWRQTYADGRVIDRIHGWDRAGVVAYAADGTLRAEDSPADAVPYRVSLWHPRDADPAMLATWREACRVHRLVQPFEQIRRDFTRLAPESDATQLPQYAATAVDTDRFDAAVARLDWHSRRTRAAVRSDAFRLAYREFPDDHVSVVAPCTDSANPIGTVLLGAAWFHRTDDRARTPLPLGAIAPRVYSEAVRDLSVLAGGNPVAGDEISDRVDYREHGEHRDHRDHRDHREYREYDVPQGEVSDSIG